MPSTKNIDTIRQGRGYNIWSAPEPQECKHFYYGKEKILYDIEKKTEN